jgi:hypothetical protein
VAIDMRFVRREGRNCYALAPRLLEAGLRAATADQQTCAWLDTLTVYATHDSRWATERTNIPRTVYP